MHSNLRKKIALTFRSPFEASSLITKDLCFMPYVICMESILIKENVICIEYGKNQ